MENKNFQFSVFNFRLFNILKEHKWTMLVGLGIEVLYFGFRLINLPVFPIFADEAIYIRWAQVMRAEPTLRFLPLSDGKQPLFMWFLMPILSFFQNPLAAGRMLSVVAGLGTLMGVFFLGYFLFLSKTIALIAAFLYAIVPFAVFFDRMALVDSLLTMFGTWALLLGVLLVKYQRLDLAIFTGLALGGALLTKSPSIFFVFLLPATVILLSFKSKKYLLLQLIKLVGLWLVVYIFAYGLYNIQRLGPNFQMIALRNRNYVFSFQEIIGHPLDPFKPHLSQISEWFQAFLGWPLIFFFFGGIFWGIRKWPRQTIFLLICVFFPLLTQMTFAKVFTARYILFVIPFFLVLGAIFIDWVFRLVSRFKTTFVLRFMIKGAILAIIILPCFIFNFLLIKDPQKAPLPKGERAGYLEEWTSGYGINEIRDYLKSLPKDKQIIVGTEGYFGTLPDGLQIYFDKDPKVTIIGVGLGLDKVPEQLIDSASCGNPSYLVVNKSRMRAQNDPGLKLVMEIPKAKGEKGQDFLQLYQVK